MSRTTYSPTLRKHLPLLVAAIACVAVSAAAATTWLATPAASLTQTLQSGSGHEKVETERITIRPTGFEPVQLTRPQGEFILAADNLSGLRELTLVLERENGGLVRERRITLEQFKWRARLDLHPGRYVVRAAGRPDWACTLTITPK